MSYLTSATTATAVYPDPELMMTTSDADIDIDRPTLSPTLSSASSIASSFSESDQPSQRPGSRKSRAERPRMSERQRSSTIIVPKNRMNDAEVQDYPPDDARAMSPRRNSQDIERLEKGVRQTLREQARTLQSSLAALAEKIDEVKQDHDKLESENKFLQDYIGGLTRTMSRDSNLGRSSSSAKKKAKR